MRYVTAALLLVHGLLHLIGFFKPWKVDGFRGVGVLWLIAAVALTTAALLCLMDRETWWTVAAPAIVLSQALIVLQWGDAWAGTVVNLLLVVAVASGAGTQQFHADSLKRARALLAKAPVGAPPILGVDEISGLPSPVRRWLEASGAVGRPRARTVRLLQRGGLRTAPDQPYMPASAAQYFLVDEPGFVWTVDVTMMRVIPIVGRDSYVDGLGRMFIKAGAPAWARSPRIT